MPNENDFDNSIFDPVAEYLALTDQNEDAPQDPREDAREDAAVARILGNLGLTRPGLATYLDDSSLESAVNEWALEPATHRGDSESIFELDEDTREALAGSQEEIVELKAHTSEIDSQTTRVEVTVSLPDRPALRREVIAVVEFTDRDQPIRFPLELENEGSEDFSLYALTGGATVPNPRGRIRNARLEFGLATDN